MKNIMVISWECVPCCDQNTTQVAFRAIYNTALVHTTRMTPFSSLYFPLLPIIFCCMIFPNWRRDFNLVFKRDRLPFLSAFRKTRCHSGRGRARAAGTRSQPNPLLRCCILPCLLVMQKAVACRHQVMEGATDSMAACRLHRDTMGKGACGCRVAHMSFQHLLYLPNRNAWLKWLFLFRTTKFEGVKWLVFFLTLRHCASFSS